MSEKLNHSYRYLSSFFSKVGTTTIAQYLICLKIERIKELIVLEEQTISEIAHKLHYSLVAHLSNQLKKITGLQGVAFTFQKAKREKEDYHSGFIGRKQMELHGGKI